MSSVNEHTGQKQQTKVPSETYRSNYDLIFGKKKQEEGIQPEDCTCVGFHTNCTDR